MFRFIFHKLLSKRWMALCLLIGNILMVAITASNPLYSNAVLQKTLTQNLSRAITEDNINPTSFTLMSSISKSVISSESVQKLHRTEQAAQDLYKTLRMPQQLLVEERYVSSVKTLSQMGRRTDPQNFSLGKRVDIENNIEFITGRMCSDTLVDGNTIEIIVSERMMKQYDLLENDVLDLTNLYIGDTEDKTYQAKIVGIYRAKEGSDLYWSSSPLQLCSYLVMNEALFDELFVANESYPYGISSWWYIYLDYTGLKRADVPHVINQITALETEFEGTFRQKLVPYIENYEANAAQLDITLLILQAPILVLVCAFIFMVSRQLIELEENEISVIKSRGASKKQILQLYLIQGLMLSGAGLVLGIPLAFLICMMLGASNAFLEFVQRAALPVSLTWETIVFALAAMLIACATMVIPAIRHANVSIVAQKVRKQRKSTMPWWQKCGLDVILIIVSLYSIYAYQGYRSQGGAQQLDLLLYFSSSLFIIGVGLLGIRLIPYLIHLVFFIGKKKWSPALYASFQRVVRTKNSQTFIMLFLVLTIALGIFNADTARSINTNNEDQIYYYNGCDVRAMEAWVGNESSQTYTEPLFSKYTELEGVRSATKVFFSPGETKKSGEDFKTRMTLMRIETKEFGETAWFKTSLLPEHWYHYLNAMAQSPDAILVSSNYRNPLGYNIGDTLTYTDKYGNSYTGTIYGFVDYWPGYYPYTQKEDGTKEDNFLVVANLAYLQSIGGVLPYEVWMDFEDSTSSIYTYAQENNLYFQTFSDASASFIDLKNDPVFQGTNGMLTTNFIVILLLCTVGFLIYWILSIQSRTLQFGIFRAMGMNMREIITMLVSEQILISGTAVVIGFVAGILSSKIFVPLVQAAYLPEQQFIPMESVSQIGDLIRLCVVIGIMILACLGVIARIVSRIKISQALKLGED